MFCDQCGSQLQAGASQCVRCGKRVFGQVEFRRGRVREHVRLVGILWMAYSALHLVGGVVVILVGKILFGRLIHIPNGPPPEVLIWLRPLITLVGCLLVTKAAIGFIAGWGLLQKEPWARTVALVVAFIALLNVPLGTALGIYTLWVLLPSQSDDEYNALAQAA
jgi:hypothetical protein